MKTITLLTAILCLNISIADAKKFRAVETNLANQPVRITICLGEKDKITKPLKKYEISYDSKGVLLEKQMYIWDTKQKTWLMSHKYKYSFNTEKKLTHIQYSNWNENAKLWNIEYQIFSDKKSTKLLAEK